MSVAVSSAQCLLVKASLCLVFGGIGVYHGDLSPLSSRSVVEVCVMPFLMYGLKKLDPE